MAGTRRYQTGAFNATSTIQNQAQALFVMVWGALKWGETNGVCTEIARNNGNAATYANPLGTDFYDGANPFGEQAWAIFSFPVNAGRLVPFAVFLAWSSGSNSFNSGTNAPGRVHGSAGANMTLGMQMAFALDSGGNPVSPVPLAATGNMGADVKQSPVWATPAGGQLYVFPMSNGAGGNYDTNKENCGGISSSSSPSRIRVNVWMDDDVLGVEVNFDDLGHVQGVLYMGMYTPLPGFTPEIPFFMLGVDGVQIMSSNTAMGSLNGSSTKMGGISVNKDGVVYELRTQFDDNLLQATSPTTHLDAGPSWLLHQIPLCNGVLGQVGWMDPELFRMTKNLTHRSLMDGQSKRVIAQSTDASTVKMVTTWDLSVPGSSFTRQGNRS